MRSLASLMVAFILMLSPMVAGAQCRPQPAKHWVCAGKPSHATGYLFTKVAAAKCQEDAKRVTILEEIHQISGEKTGLLIRCRTQVATVTKERDAAMVDVVNLSNAVTKANATTRQSNDDKVKLAKVAHDLNDRLQSSWTTRQVGYVAGGSFLTGVAATFIYLATRGQ